MTLPPTERTREPATPLERGALRLFRLSSLGGRVIVTGFLGYLVLGTVCHWTSMTPDLGS